MTPATPIDAAALAKARERLERMLVPRDCSLVAMNGTGQTMLGTNAQQADLRLVLDALRDARRQAFEEAALGCHLRAGALSRQGKKSAAREAEACGNCIEALGKEQA